MTARPVLLVQRKGAFPPGLLGDRLARGGVTLVSVLADEPEAMPAAADLPRFSGLVLAGGQGSASGEEPRLLRELALACAALDAEMPVLGHGLGARVLARAAGGRIRPADRPEAGWQLASRHPPATEAPWTRVLAGGPHRVFVHHEEICEVPPSGAALLSSAQAPALLFALGPSLGAQFHPELTRTAFEAWLDDPATILPPPGVGVQSRTEMRAEAAKRLADSRPLAESLYDAWLSGLEDGAPEPERSPHSPVNKV